ncbi:30S ribosomal protein S6 [bacterium]|nr:30S ribosomal protein S6 [bacterium]MBT7310337.1 30S ribosomal protein S6 [bacterium]
MTKYEMIFVLNAEQPESEMESRVEKVRGIIARQGGEITETNHWGVRTLAYEIKHNTRGNYMHILFTAQGDEIAEIDNEFRLDYMVLRHLVVVDDEWAARNEASMSKRRRGAAAVAPAAIEAPVVTEAPAETEPVSEDDDAPTEAPEA